MRVPHAAVGTLLLYSVFAPFAVCAAAFPATGARKYTCSSVANALTGGTFLSQSTPDANGAVHILVPPAAASRLCTLTRVNQDKEPRNHIPIARSYDTLNWHRNQGRYVDDVKVLCATTTTDGPMNYMTRDPEWAAGEDLCQISVPRVGATDVGYFLTAFANEGGVVVGDRTKAARLLERYTWGPTWDEITALQARIAQHGDAKAFAMWVHEQVYAFAPTSHRAYFRKRANPTAVESYQYGVSGPLACKANARYRRHAFTVMDVELSRGSSAPAGNNGHPFTTMQIENNVGGGFTVVKFGGDVRTVLDAPLQHANIVKLEAQYWKGTKEWVFDDATVTDLPDGEYTICHVENAVGTSIGGFSYDGAFQILVGDRCTASFTDRRGIADGKGDGSDPAPCLNKEEFCPINSRGVCSVATTPCPANRVQNPLKVNGQNTYMYDSARCNAKCRGSNVRYITVGNPEVRIPAGYTGLSDLSWVDLSDLEVPTDLGIVNEAQTGDSSWILKTDLSTCDDENGNAIPDPAGLSSTDYMSTGRGKFNIDKPIFAKMPPGVDDTNTWALNDLRTVLHENTKENPMPDGGGLAMRRAGRLGSDNAGNPKELIVTRCSNANRNAFNEQDLGCILSFDADACVSRPLPDESGRRFSVKPDDSRGEAELLSKFAPEFAGPNGPGVVVCGAENEEAPDPSEDDSFHLTNRKLESSSIVYGNQKKMVWTEIVLSANDQLCQRVGWSLQKIFATSTATSPDSGNSEANMNVLDNFVTSCFSTFKDVITRASFNEEMGEQLTYRGNRAAHTLWHSHGQLTWPDENYARENLQLHTMGLIKLNDDGTPVLDEFGKRSANYQQKNIFESAKIWTGFYPSQRRGNYEDLHWATTSYLDPMKISDVNSRDWFPKIDFDDGYIGDRFPLCSDLPRYHFLKLGAAFRLLGGDPSPLLHKDPDSWFDDQEIHRLTLDSNSHLYQALCNPKSPSPPSSTLLSGTGIAMYDASSYTAPFCSGSKEFCDSNTLLEGRADEVNSPNTIDDCKDGTDPDGDITESVKKIRIESVKGRHLRGGEVVRIKATVVAALKYDRVDFWFTADASTPSPTWSFISTANPIVGENDYLTLPYNSPHYAYSADITYNLPPCNSESGCHQAVRVVLRSARSGIRSGDGQHKPTLSCGTRVYDDSDDLVFEVLPSYRPQDLCNFSTSVTLGENLVCHERECAVSTVRVVEVVPGVFYEYIRAPCVQFLFYPDPSEVFSNHDNNFAMCADKRLPSAISTCCGGYSNRNPGNGNWADVLSEYRYEHLTYADNESRCSAWGRNVCDPSRIGPTAGWRGHCAYYQSCKDVRGSRTHVADNRYHWTDASCAIKVKVSRDGLIAVVHKPSRTTPQRTKSYPAYVQSHVLDSPINSPSNNVSNRGTVSNFHVQWSRNNIGKLEYPNPGENSCGNGTSIEDGEYCLCDTVLNETVVFSALPTKAQVQSQLKVGAFDPTTFSGDYTPFVESEGLTAVSAYKQTTDNAEYTVNTIFRIKEEYSSQYKYFKNVLSVVEACGTTFSFRNSPTFYDIARPELFQAYQEVDAYIDAIHNHPSTPPFTCTSLLKNFGFSNPTPLHILACSLAFKMGVYTYTPSDSSDAITFGVLGQRGNLAAMAASIIMHEDSINPAVDSDPGGGGVKSPLLRLTQLMRGFQLTRTSHHRRSDGYVNAHVIGESPYGIPDQFSFYSPFFTPAGAHLESYLVSPESELLNMNRIVDTQNAFHALFHHGLANCDGGVGPRWTRGKLGECGGRGGEQMRHNAGHLGFIPTGDLSSGVNVVGQLATLLTADRLTEQSRLIIVEAYEANYNAAEGSPGLALQVAQDLISSTPEFHTYNRVSLSNTEREITEKVPRDKEVTYKAIVNVQLFGGMDSMNMLTPHPEGCPALWEEYKHRRGADLALTENEIVKIDLDQPDQPDQPCSSFGVHKGLNGLADMFSEGDAIFFANIGHLQKPVDRYNFNAETQAQLFSHHSMTEEVYYVDAFYDRSGTGVLGRMSDVLGNSMAAGQTSINSLQRILSGNPRLGKKVDIISSGHSSANQLFRIPAWPSTLPTTESKRDYIIKRTKLLNPASSPGNNIHAELWSQSFIDAEQELDKYTHLITSDLIVKGKTDLGSDQYTIHLRSSAEGSVDVGDSVNPGQKCPGVVLSIAEDYLSLVVVLESDTACTTRNGNIFYKYPNDKSSDIPNTGLGNSLNMMFRLMKLRDLREVNRDVFAVQIGGFDQHFSMKSGLTSLFSQINGALVGFRTALQAEMLDDGTTLWDHVTVVMESEFGRTITPNASGGTDHGWGGNHLVMGGKIKGGRVLGSHPTTYNQSDLHNTGRGAWIPTTSLEAPWYGIANWFGISSTLAINYVLPNLGNFGCRLYSSSDLYIDGTGSIPGCGGEVVDLEQTFYITEPRLLNPDEQIQFCQKVVNQFGGEDVKCVVLDQILAAGVSSGIRRLTVTEFTLNVNYEVSTDEKSVVTMDEIVENLSTDEFKKEVVTVSEIVETANDADAITRSPTTSPSKVPTSPPTRPDVCTLVTVDMFTALSVLPDHGDFCLTVNQWNAANPGAQIFMDGDEVDRVQELAAFFGNVFTSPDLVAMEPITSWSTAIEFWMTTTGSSGRTCHDAVIDNGSFGETLAIINGNVECVESPDDDTKSVVKSRLNTYCNHATQLELNSYDNTILLEFDGCTSLQMLFDDCVDEGQSSGVDACMDCMSWAGKTLSPTRAPTKTPTSTPSEAPSTSPTTTTKSPTDHPTKGPTPSPSSSPTAKYVLPKYYGYEYISEGNCKDDHAFVVTTYDYLHFDSLDSVDECPRVCAPFRHMAKFRGLEFESPSIDPNDEAQSTCKCLFDADTDLSGEDITEPTHIETGTASGVIAGVNLKSHVDCYKVSALNAPEDVIGYEYVGFGQCLDSNNGLYNYDSMVAFAGFVTECKDACASSNGRGFWTKEESACHCLNDSGTGVGEITTSNYATAGGHCYRFVPEPTDNPTSSPTTVAPTKSPSRSPTPSPTPPPSDCFPCSNTATSWMDQKGFTCESRDPSWFRNRCINSNIWRTNKFCQRRCFDVALAYDSELCCPLPPACDASCAADPLPWVAAPGSANKCDVPECKECAQCLTCVQGCYDFDQTSGKCAWGECAGCTDCAEWKPTFGHAVAVGQVRYVK